MEIEITAPDGSIARVPAWVLELSRVAADAEQCTVVAPDGARCLTTFAIARQLAELALLHAHQEAAGRVIRPAAFATRGLKP